MIQASPGARLADGKALPPTGGQGAGAARWPPCWPLGAAALRPLLAASRGWRGMSVAHYTRIQPGGTWEGQHLGPLNAGRQRAGGGYTRYPAVPHPPLPPPAPQPGGKGRRPGGGRSGGGRGPAAPASANAPHYFFRRGLIISSITRFMSRDIAASSSSSPPLERLEYAARASSDMDRTWERRNSRNDGLPAACAGA